MTTKVLSKRCTSQLLFVVLPLNTLTETIWVRQIELNLLLNSPLENSSTSHHASDFTLETELKS